MSKKLCVFDLKRIIVFLTTLLCVVLLGCSSHQPPSVEQQAEPITAGDVQPDPGIILIPHPTTSPPMDFVQSGQNRQVEETAASVLSQPEITQIPETWRAAYAELLTYHMEMNDGLYFLLYDFDKDDIPELIVVGEYMNEAFDAVYTFRDNEALPLEYDEDVFSTGSVLHARGGVTAAPGNAPGLITYFYGPSAGNFGADARYNRIVIDGNKLVIDACGMKDVDVETLHALFDNFGRGTDDYAALDVAIQEHTRYYINDSAVSEIELNRMLAEEAVKGNNLSYFRITESNIREIVFSSLWQDAY